MLIVIDWDDTITARDTIELLSTPQCHGPPFGHYTDAYMREYEEYKKAVKPPSNFGELYAFLSGLAPVEKRSLDRIADGGLFRGITADELGRRAAGIRFREMWPEAHRWMCQRRNCDVYILSVNWSSVFIERALGESCIRIIANDIESSSGRIVGPGGDADNRVCTAADKLARFEQLKRGDTSVYIGDSTTDLMCLLSADVGILMGERAVERIRGVGVTLVSVGEWLRGRRGELVVAADWGEVVQVLGCIDGDDATQ